MKKYQAFISYRHHPLDSAVAEDLQKMIERFRIPRSLQKKSGIRNLHEAVFLDKTELPITEKLIPNFAGLVNILTVRIQFAFIKYL